MLNLYEQMFQTVLSLHFGRTFWLDEQMELMSAPTYKDGTTDWDLSDYVSEWTDLEGLNMDRLLSIHKRLIIQRYQEDN